MTIELDSKTQKRLEIAAEALSVDLDDYIKSILEEASMDYFYHNDMDDPFDD